MKKILLLVIGTVIFSCNPDENEVVDCALTDLTLKVTKVEIADCGLENGVITVQAEGGSPPYQYSVQEGSPQTSNEFKDLGPQLEPYTLYVTDNNGCTQSTATFLGQKGPFAANVSVTPSGCEDSNGTIVAEAFNGVPPYKYQLGENGTYQDHPNWDDLPAGIYTVWIADANNCYKGITEIRIPSGVSFSESVSPIISSTCALPDCHGGSQPPDFRVFSNIEANAEKIRTKIKDGSMPKEGTLTEDEIKLIVCWVEDEAPNN